MSSDKERNADSGTREYRVLWWSEAHDMWASHTGSYVTDSPKVAATWLEQARSRSSVDPVIETRLVGPWTTVTPPVSGTPDEAEL